MRTALTGRRCAEPPGTIGEVRGNAATVATGDEWLDLVAVAAGGRRRPANEIVAAGQVLEDGA